MAVIRNKASEPKIVGYGMPRAVEVAQDATVEVPDDAVDNYTLAWDGEKVVDDDVWVRVDVKSKKFAPEEAATSE